MASKRKLTSTDIDIDTQNKNKKSKNCCSNIRISATKTRNYLLNDPLIDWLEMYGKTEGFVKKSPQYLTTIFKDGIDFEKKIMKIIFERFDGQYISITKGNYQKRICYTKNAMNNGIPIIYQGVVENSLNNSFGIPDLIVRVDFLNKLMNNEIVSSIALSSNPVYASSYCIIDIKHSTIHLVKSDKTIYNSRRIQPYKGQIIIYSEALAELQNGYVPPFAYILGRRTKISNTFYEPFDYLGVVDLHGKDASVVIEAHRAIRWRQELQCHGSTWPVWGPHRWEMAPNMCNQYKAWEDVKYKLAYHQGEITLLLKAGFNDRNKLWKDGVCSWRSRRFNSKLLKASVKHQALLTQALEVNRTDYQNFLPMRININRKIKSFQDWQGKTKCLELYIDFETANDSIFLIGMGYENTGQWQFEYFIADTLDKKGESQVVRQWLARIKQIQNGREPIRFIHWGYAERNNYKNALQRHNIRDITVEWVDLYKFFLEIPISIRGSFRYGLKDIATSLHAMKYIQTIWKGSMDGLSVTIAVKKIELSENKRLIEEPIMTNIIDYNEVDCKVLWEILHFVRNNM